MRKLSFAVAVWTVSALVALACGTENDSTFPDGAGDSGPSSSGDPGPIGTGGDGSVDPATQVIHVEPADPVVTFTSGQPAPAVAFKAVTASGVTVPATWVLDRGELGTLGAGSGAFAATGSVGGKGTVSATWNGRTAATSITVKLAVSQNGPGAGDDAGAGGAGGAGGVGGEGLGGAVTDPATLDALKKPPTADAGLAFLYPYDKTVWPRGLLAPLLQWSPGAIGDYDAVAIKITEASFTYEGTFAKPAGATPFRRHPIPQAAWRQMLQSNGGEDVTVSLVFAKNGVSYGPITETWKVASAPLKGTVYYNSYGTRLAKNYGGAKGGDGRFGGATLAIRGGSSDPTLVAGGDGDASYCRVCHSVAQNGSVLITQRNSGSDRRFSTYDLKTGAETTMSPEGSSARFAWPAIYPDGSLFLNDSSAADGSTGNENELWQVVSGAGPQTPTKVNATGWPSGFRAAFPSFAPDGKQLAFTMYAGVTDADRRTIGTMAFDKATSAFSGLVKRYTPPNPAHTALYPSFTPNGKGIVFHVETRYNGHDYGGTRSDADVSPPDSRASIGTRAELWYLDLATNTATRLDRLNGLGYVPTGPESHDDDTTLNYEPTVNPVVSGGYAWVVFTSRRLYGNVATINPWYSDPRYHDLTSTPTPKKLWVAAIDLNAPPGTDPSHPAFYLPGQELLAGNMRGYWVVDPCKAENGSCETGDECCGGYCRPNQSGALVCTDKVPVCAQEFEKCTKDADCCGSPSVTCVNGRCAAPGPK